MAKSHKDQHWIPQSYLAAWTDPDVPAGHTPFVHVFSRDGSRERCKAPTNIFKETDLYTIIMPDGTRDLQLERGLTGLEQAFCKIRRDFLDHRRSLPTVRHAKLMVFVAAMHARTPAMRDHHGKFWKDARSLGEELMASVKNRTPDDKRRIANHAVTSSEESLSFSYEQVAKLAENPMQSMLEPFIRAEAPRLVQMEAKVLCTEADPGFITSDAPVVWFDPEWYRKPPMYQSPGFLDPKLEITIPISPRQLLLLTHGDSGLTYLDVPDLMVSEVNHRTRFHCHEEFVVRRNYQESRWFEVGEIPDDAREPTQADEGSDSLPDT